MRPVLAALLWSSALTTSVAGGEQIFPYKAFITTDDVYVRSGPGQSYFPTDKLKAGWEVEVYRHDPGGWYAIRPPEGSFSWVAARHLQWDSRPQKIPGIATVNADRVAARVGSRFSDIRDVIQVRLHELEPVEVLEEKKARSGSEATTWYKIAPPSGEFRWVFGKYVDADYPHDGIRKAPAGNSPLVPRTADEPEKASPSASLSPATPAAEDDRQQAAEGPSAVTVRPPSQPETTPVGVWEPIDAGQPGDQPVAPRTVSPDEFRAEIEGIDMELSIMVVEEPTVWVFDQLQQRAESLLVQAETAVQRGRARQLANKIARFENIKRRYDRINLVRRETERRNRRLAELGPTDRADGRPRDSEDRFDGVGELTRVVSPKLGAPRYALLDHGGQVQCYVSPAPGVNLRYYVGRRVGVNGSRGYMPEQHAHHIMAQHVSVVGDRLLR